MKKPQYISSPYIFLSMICIPFLSSIVLLILKEYYPSLISIIIAIIFLVPFVILRKKFFSKLLINEQGFEVYYRNTVIKKLNWEDIKVAVVFPTSHGFQITFSNHDLYLGKDKWKNFDEIFINLNSNFAIELYKYSKNLKVKLQNIEKLPKSIQEKFNNF